MKHMKHWLLAAAMLLCSVAMSAETVEIDGIWYNLVFKAKQAEVAKSGDTKYSGSITIPATVIYEGVEYSVTSIGDDAFYYCRELTSITISEGVMSIGMGAFSWCTNLTVITLPKSMVSIKSSAFSYCRGLASLTLPEKVTSIEESTFSGCRSLISLVLPENVTSVGDFAFVDCINLASITLPECVTSIGFRAFDGCSKLTSITIPEGVVSIGDYAFRGCSSLTSITIPKDIISVGSYAFYGCSSLTTIVLPKSVSSIYSEAFSNCPELTDVYCYADSMTTAEANAFNGSYIEYATLHVPASTLTDYKNTVPWSGFGKFETISIAVASITLSESSTTLTEGETFALTVIISPDDATDKTITWATSAESVATVDNKGKVTAIAPGTATITATANDASGISASCEVQVKERETSVVIDDPYVGDSFVLRENVENVGITYTRNYTGNWEALYVPFEITVDEAFLSSFEVAYINDVRSYDNDNNGEVDDMVMEAFKITSGTLRTSYPYLIRAKNAGEATITVTDATLYATTAENMHSVNCSSVYMEYTVSGTYATMTADQLDGCYAMSKGGAWIEASSPSATLRPFRLYLSMESRDDSYLKVNPTALKAIRLKVDGEETTAIEHSEFRIQNSELIYDLQGRRVENPDKGVYIVNGKKVIYK